MTAINYSPTANRDDGSCHAEPTVACQTGNVYSPASGDYSANCTRYSDSDGSYGEFWSLYGCCEAMAAVSTP